MKHLSTLICIADVARSGSVRRTAERLNTTPSALTRRIQEFELELGTSLFDRTRLGMRPTAAGELLVEHARSQVADLDRVRVQIAELSSLRRGHVAVVCSQAFTDNVMPDEIGASRARFPEVSFSLQVRDHGQAIAALITYEAELALILQPPRNPELKTLFTCELPVCIIMDAQHPLARHGPVRLRDCFNFPVAMPDRSLSIRHLLDTAILHSDLTVVAAIESGSIDFLRNCVRRECVLSFQISIGIPAVRTGLTVREIDRRDLRPMRAVLMHLRGRTLSSASTEFVDQVSHSLRQRLTVR